MIQSVLLWLDTHLVDTQNPTITTKNYDSCDNFPSSDTVDWSRGIISSDKVKKNYRAEFLIGRQHLSVDQIWKSRYLWAENMRPLLIDEAQAIFAND